MFWCTFSALKSAWVSWVHNTGPSNECARSAQSADTTPHPPLALARPCLSTGVGADPLFCLVFWDRGCACARGGRYITVRHLLTSAWVSNVIFSRCIVFFCLLFGSTVVHWVTAPPQGCIRREGTPEAEAVRQAVGGGCQSGWRRLLSVTNATEAGTWRQGDSGWAWLGGGGGGGSPPSNASLPLPTRVSCASITLSNHGVRCVADLWSRM